MNAFKQYFKILMESSCPLLYERGELLILSDKALTCPEQKATCLILVREMTKLLFEVPEVADPARVYSCSGCTGLIKFIRVQDDEAIGGDREEGLVLDQKEQQLLERICNFPLIQTIPELELPILVRGFRKERFPAGATLISKGQNSLYLYLVIAGELVVVDGALSIAGMGPGDICGEMSYLGDDVAGADVRAVTEVEVLSIAGTAFCQLIDRIPELQLYMARLLARRLRVSNARYVDTFDAGMSGWVREMVPAELFQIFHLNQKTGVLSMKLPGGEAKVSFREGCVINASYGEKENQDAIFAMLKEREGRYSFTTGLNAEEMKAAEIGDFIMLLMEGIKRVDEAEEE